MYEEEFEGTKGVVRIHKLKKGQTTQWPKEKRQKGQTMIYKCVLLYVKQATIINQ